MNIKTDETWKSNNSKPYFGDYWNVVWYLTEIKKYHNVEIDVDKSGMSYKKYKGWGYQYYEGWATCRVCGINNGSIEYVNKGLGLRIPEGYLHYITEHSLVPDSNLITIANAESCKCFIAGPQLSEEFLEMPIHTK